MLFLTLDCNLLNVDKFDIAKKCGKFFFVATLQNNKHLFACLAKVSDTKVTRQLTPTILFIIMEQSEVAMKDVKGPQNV